MFATCFSCNFLYMIALPSRIVVLNLLVMAGPFNCFLIPGFLSFVKNALMFSVSDGHRAQYLNIKLYTYFSFAQKKKLHINIKKR